MIKHILAEDHQGNKTRISIKELANIIANTELDCLTKPNPVHFETIGEQFAKGQKNWLEKYQKEHGDKPRASDLFTKCLETINDKYDEIKRFNKLSHNSFTKSRKQRLKEYQTGFKKSLNTLSK